jgi:hypothetical protein
MGDLGAILAWLRYRKVVKNRKITEDALLRLNALTVTIHGRLMLSKVCLDEDNGIPIEIKRMYWVLLQQAPIQEYAQRN